MEIRKFEDLEVWQEAMKLSVELHTELKSCRHFGLRDQVFRSAISIPSNIAEGLKGRPIRNSFSIFTLQRVPVES